VIEKYACKPRRLNCTLYVLNIHCHIANTEQDFETAKILFQEYAASLSVDLSFQDFEKELKTLQVQYHSPKGCLVIVYFEEKAIGCAAVRELETDIAELKRMYLKPEYRRHKVGEQLLSFMLKKTKALGYKKIRLDTLPEMKAAKHLYQRFGFVEIERYRFNPVKGTVYMEKTLLNM
jgi:putative acetyltransferase